MSDSQNQGRPVSGIGDYFTRLFITGAARVILKVVYMTYSAFLVGLLCLVVGTTLLAFLALIGTMFGPVPTVIACVLACCLLVLGPLPNWVKSILAQLHAAIFLPGAQVA